MMKTLFPFVLTVMKKLVPTTRDIRKATSSRRTNLVQRRDALYHLVEKGVIQAQIVANKLGLIQQSQGTSLATESAQQAASEVPYAPSKDAEAVLAEALEDAR